MTVRSTFSREATALEVIAGHDLSGKVAVITGGASGIGLETTRALLHAGARVLVAVRDPERAAEALTTLEARPGMLETVTLDLASLASVRAAAAQVLAMTPKVHLLFDNAGTMATPFGHTEGGFETQFGTNHLGHFLFTTLLMPALLNAAPARVVVLTSSGHRRSDVHLDDPNFERRPYEKWSAYGQSKTANSLFAVELTRRYAAQGVTANAVHPGGIMTNLQRFLPREEQLAMGWMDEQGNLNPLFKTPEQGAATSIWAAVGSELEGVGGLFLEDVGESLPFDPAQPFTGYMPYARDPQTAQALWTLSEELVNPAASG
ncbi:oxidoreductase [Deinococcus altitudinis]|uniref:oxidoreductase n=1 Tax=Deinococcus altitudinis TaxID=468914 RepID=UPI0038921945